MNHVTFVNIIKPGVMFTHLAQYYDVGEHFITS